MGILIPLKNSSTPKYTEVSKLSGDEDFQYLKDFFKKLAEDKGGEYAFEVLKLAKIKPNTDLHLLGHYVGEILYKQKGSKGMEYCTHDFRNACSHTIVVGLFQEKGSQALPEIVEACKLAPGGKGAYNMCFHGLGHGVLAFTGYSIEKAVDICSSLEKQATSGREFPECVGGIIMEIISGGDHDKKIWESQREKYLETEDPLYPCSSSMIPRAAKERCFSYITPHLFEFDGGNRNNPSNVDFERAFKYCAVSAISEMDQQACYEGFGKEFVVLARDRDIRKIAEITDSEIEQVYEWCSLAPNSQGIEYCLRSSLINIYWGGENSVDGAIRFCNLIEKLNDISCFKTLIENVSYYITDKNYKKEFCTEIPEKYKESCEAII